MAPFLALLLPRRHRQAGADGSLVAKYEQLQSDYAAVCQEKRELQKQVPGTTMPRTQVTWYGSGRRMVCARHRNFAISFLSSLQIDEMTTFLDDYGLQWIGDDKPEGKFDKDRSAPAVNRNSRIHAANCVVADVTPGDFNLWNGSAIVLLY